MKINNYYVGRKVRDLTNYQAPNFEMEDNVVPSLIINPSNAGVEVQPALPKANANQQLKIYFAYCTGSASAAAQISTVTPTKDVYFVGISYDGDATGCNVKVGDATSGNIDTTDGTSECLAYCQGNKSLVVAPPLPVKCTNGLRILRASTTGNTFATIFYIEETKPAL